MTASLSSSSLPGVPARSPTAPAIPHRAQWSSSQLLGERKEVEISHAGSVYRLRVTALGKLILTK